MECNNRSVENVGVNSSVDMECEDVEDLQNNQKLVLDDEEIMKLQFSSADNAEQFYKLYAKIMGFDARRCHNTTDQGRVTIMHWECCRAGTRKPLSVGRKRLRKETPNLRCKCTAKFRISLDSSSSLYKVILFESTHNHDLVTPASSEQLKGNSSITESDKALLTLMRNAGIRPCQSMNYVEQTKGGTGQLLRRKKKMYNFLGKERVQTMRAGDINIAMSLLEGMKINDPEMLFESTVDKEGKLNRLFWCDGFSRSAFKSFGDVLICDSTYKTNTYRFPLVILSGIDNHFKCTIFGAALLQNETIESYEWLFKNFVQAMGGKTPNVVVTDQDEAMRVAIKLAFPKAIHRLCGWHLQRNCTQNVKVHGFCNVFGKLLKKRCSVEEFEMRWINETDKHGVTDNSWVKSTYARKEMWSDAYLRGHFVGMTRTTQRAESMNFVFKQQGKAGSTITELLKHFHHVLTIMRMHFRDLQRKSETSPSNIQRGAPLYPMYNSLASVYTNSIMDKVEKEMAKEQGFVVDDKVVGDNGDTRFLLSKYASDSLKKWSVNVNVNKGIFVCECNMLEADGLPCRHLFNAFKNMKIRKIPEKCILHRWTTEVGRELAVYFTLKTSTGDPELQRFMQIHKECSSLCVKGKQSQEDTAKSIHLVKQSARYIPTKEGPSNRGNELKENDKFTHSKTNVLDPKRIPTRGAPARQAQHCSICGLPGHKSGTCKNKPNGVKNGVTVKSRRKKGVEKTGDELSKSHEDFQHLDDVSEEI